MTRYLLDTNIVSDTRRPQPNAELERWYAAQSADDLYISTFTIAEIEKGILLMPFGRRRDDFERWFAGAMGPRALFRGRLLPFEERAASEWAKLVADGFLAGKPRSGLDMIVAAVALANDCTLVTANERHFVGVIPFLNPMKG
ncbi:MAG: PIN domain-containing protein [Rhizomicrobium sp.]